jgi:phosphoribosyl-ATP pyrophosphohydrolase
MDTLSRLERTVAERRAADPSQSYVASLHSKGLPQIARKLGEEGVEAAVATLSGSRDELVGEAADILFHLVVALQARDIPLAAVLAELDRREGR